MFSIPADLHKKALASSIYIDIIPTEKGVKVFRKKIDHDLIDSHIKWLIEKALSDLYEEEIALETEIKPFDLVERFLKPHSGYVGSACVLRDRQARIISLLGEAYALLQYQMGEEQFNQMFK